ncbi:hypothetical protein CXR24_11955 [Brevibacterium aurantiacum]|nr:hypothetical protein CXR24_11955 [Brevibacterium aurantiacum]
MGTCENDYFFEISGLHRGIIMLDEHISAVSSRRQRAAESDDRFAEVSEDAVPLNLTKLSRILSEENVTLASMNTIRDSLVARLREVYWNFADREFESLDELREYSVVGDAAEQCAFAITAVLDSFTSQLEEHTDRNNSAVELLLDFSDELGLPDQAKGVQVPPLGLGVVRLSEGVGTPCNGIRVGSDELRVVDEAQTVIEFINQIAEVARNVISEVSSSERFRVVEREIFSVAEDCEYAYGEAIFPSKEGGVR